MDYAVFILLFLSGFFSGSETALFSIGKINTLSSQSGNAVEKMIADILSTPKRLDWGAARQRADQCRSFGGQRIHYKPISDESLSIGASFFIGSTRGATPSYF